MIKISKKFRIGVLAVAMGAMGSQVFAQAPQVPNGPAANSNTPILPPNNYWQNHWSWYDNTYQPYYLWQFRQQPGTGNWQGYSGPPSVNRGAGVVGSPTGTFYQGGGYESGRFQRPVPYGWW